MARGEDDRRDRASERREIEMLEAREHKLKAALLEAENELAIARATMRAMQSDRDAILLSTSWRITQPLRKAKTAWRVFFRDRSLFVALLKKNLRLAPKSAGRRAVPALIEEASSDPLSRRKAELLARLQNELTRRARAAPTSSTAS